jgi:uncharacterized protein YdcH (DUF465 family)
MEDVRSDLVSVLSALEAHWTVLQAEIEELNRDIAASENCLAKYGEVFRVPVQHLRAMKRQKKAAMRDIIANLESLNQNLEGGRKLLKNMTKTPLFQVGDAAAASHARLSSSAGSAGSAGRQSARPSTAMGSTTVIHAVDRR